MRTTLSLSRPIGSGKIFSFNLDDNTDSQSATTENLRRVPVPRSPPGCRKVAADYTVGDGVEYFGATQGKWIPARVLKVNQDGTWDLDCKPAVPAEKIRWPSAADAAYAVGDVVEYYGATQGKWILAKVLKVNPSGTFDLDCKPLVPPEKIRRPPAAAKFKAGDAVEYFSSTQNRWIPAKVLTANNNNTFDLDCKPQVAPDNIRATSVAPSAPPSPQLPIPPPAASITTAADLSKPRTTTAYSTGESVEYFGATLGKWIPAKVVRANADGTYDLDCKPAVAPDRVRRPQNNSGHQAGDLVEYFSATHSKWIPAKVLSVGPRGLYNLDCKPDVAPDKIRTPGGEVPPAVPGHAFRESDAVEYFGATQGRWIPARVLKTNPDGTYDLDCKPAVPPSKVRAPGSAGLEAPSSAGDVLPPLGTVPGTQLQTLLPLAHSSSAAEAGLGQPVQLLRARRVGSAWRYEVCPEGAAALERHGPRRIAVAAVSGLQRSGKSFLLDLLTGRKQRGERCSNAPTQGLWLHGALDGDAGSPLLAFVDCEGLGGAGSDPAHSSRLMTLCALLSSVFVINSNGRLDDDVFSALAPICRLDANAEERGGEPGRPELLWLLRDLAPEELVETPDEYLEKALYSAAGGRDAPSRQPAREVRQGLLKFFRHRGCAALPPPAQGAQLQQLDRLPYSALSVEFRGGLERLRSQLIAGCLANPKAVGGQPLGCLSFVALLRQLVAAVNDDRILSMKGAWETVQHTVCGTLADELRAQAAQLLHALAAGQPVPGGAQLPLTDEALRAVLRDQRHTLKAQWDERAVGEERVRREYWQELKETLAREETLVRVRNARLADQQLMEALRSWQEWLDTDGDADAKSVSGICGQLGATMDRMPAVPLSRAGRAAVQAAARRVSASHSAVLAISERQRSLQRDAVAFRERAAQQEGTARSQLDSVKVELAEARAEVDEKEQAHGRVKKEADAAETELQDARAELRQALADIEAARVREHGLKAKHRAAADREAALRAEVEQLQASASRTEAERLAAERCAAVAGEASSVERQRLEDQLVQAQAEAEKYSEQLEGERRTLQGENERTQEEHRRRVEEVRRQLESERAALQTEQERERSEHMRMVAEARRQLEQERIASAGTLGDRKGKLLERERDAGVLEGRQQALARETDNLRQRLRELEDQVREANVALGRQSHESENARADLVTAQEEAEQAKCETERRLADEKNEYDQVIADAEEKGRRPRCGCSVM